MMNLCCTKSGYKTLTVLALAMMFLQTVSAAFKLEIGEWYNITKDYAVRGEYAWQYELPKGSVKVIDISLQGTRPGWKGVLIYHKEKNAYYFVREDNLKEFAYHITDTSTKHDLEVLKGEGSYGRPKLEHMKSIVVNGYKKKLASSGLYWKYFALRDEYWNECNDHVQQLLVPGFSDSLKMRNKYWKECDALVRHLEVLNIKKGGNAEFSDSSDKGDAEIRIVIDHKVNLYKKKVVTVANTNGDKVTVNYEAYEKGPGTYIKSWIPKKEVVEKSDLKPHEDTRLTIGDWVEATSKSGKCSSSKFKKGYIGKIIDLKFTGEWKHTVDYLIEWTHERKNAKETPS